MKDNVNIYLLWIESKLNNYKMKKSEQSYYISNKEGRSATIYHANKEIELIINDRFGDTIYQLNFHFQSYLQGKQFFENMLMNFHTIPRKEMHHILLCCSGGMTTSYFKKRLNQYFMYSHLPYIVEAVGINDVPYIYKKYELVLIAPQMAYKKERLITQLNHEVKVEVISPKTFACYDCVKLSEEIERLVTHDTSI